VVGRSKEVLRHGVIVLSIDVKDSTRQLPAIASGAKLLPSQIQNLPHNTLPRHISTYIYPRSHPQLYRNQDHRTSGRVVNLPRNINYTFWMKRWLCFTPYITVNIPGCNAAFTLEKCTHRSIASTLPPCQVQYLAKGKVLRRPFHKSVRGCSARCHCCR
jgi:hypothetical protein